ncbi:glutamine-hydrolyzing carbamoyl-phosphate synthase small subunit [Methylacidimicrobium sp. B4]|uniref:glutamine-hydrolyzing carbamoyl-phosphate synthase small subunit n=1 Tax=Methylacidimicrobium sp. B4 TaxID=2796139 RepID=UPI001A8EEE01|nr:glutamine-hydrolyzing carbamoyl-phosphate synthase small subunit [Methylacidimicrobium sp. B4]QSR85235.1 glutamine-hydrolyzing carbamoyl-phosphate synthase small subunit [Methylacidimicrobium sp. B4]
MALVRGKEAVLVLEDGEVFRGRAAGSEGTVVGEVCFNTAMSGYQEVLTDPSYRGQLVAMTFPEIGNYGVNPFDDQSSRVQVAGFLMRELSERASSWRATATLRDYLTGARVVAADGIDTRRLTLRLREHGVCRGVLSTEPIELAQAVAMARGWSYGERDFVREVTCPQAYAWETHPAAEDSWEKEVNEEGRGATRPPLRLAALDFGIKYATLRLLRRAGFAVRVVPAGTPPEEILASGIDAVFLSNGPGDPAALPSLHRTVRALVGKKPIFGICLGHQLLAFALGGRTFKLKFGHRGANHPVADLVTKMVRITSQNHGYAVDPESLPPGVRVREVSLNDGTCEAMAHEELPIFSVQYHPEAAPGPNDGLGWFSAFRTMAESGRPLHSQGGP